MTLDIDQQEIFGGTRIKSIVIKKRLALISVYGPATTNDENAIAIFFDILTTFVFTARDRGLEYIVFGDFNAHLSDFPPFVTNLPGRYLLDFMNNNNLRCNDPDTVTYFTNRN